MPAICVIQVTSPAPNGVGLVCCSGRKLLIVPLLLPTLYPPIPSLRPSFP
nr:MAG TPA: hypothetical protein [Caudoviricetes sp.]